MASAANLRSRRSVAELAALAVVEREIRTQDSIGRRKYLQDYTRAFRTYESVLDGEALKAASRSADIVLIGDYHALPASQLFAASLLEERAQPADRPVVLGVETIFARDQHVLDEWWRREISECEFRQRIRCMWFGLVDIEAEVRHAQVFAVTEGRQAAEALVEEAVHDVSHVGEVIVGVPASN